MPQTPPAALNPQSELAMISEAKDECVQSPTEVNSRNVSDNEAEPEPTVEEPTTGKDSKRFHAVKGYDDSENMWVSLGSCDKHDLPTSGYQNHRSVSVIQISDKMIFRLRKNAHYTETEGLETFLRKRRDL